MHFNGTFIIRYVIRIVKLTYNKRKKLEGILVSYQTTQQSTNMTKLKKKKVQDVDRLKELSRTTNEFSKNTFSNQKLKDSVMIQNKYNIVLTMTINKHLPARVY